jgi:tetratricopeptide (TPR) repeat protein
VYLPSAGLALFAAVLLVQTRHWPVVLLLVALCYGGRTVTRNRDWQGAETLYPNLLQTAPKSARSHYLYGDLLAFRGDDEGAIRSYDRSIAIYPGYGLVHFNRGNALTRLGRIEEAMESYRVSLRIEPGFEDAARMLEMLRAGVPVVPGIRPF